MKLIRLVISCMAMLVAFHALAEDSVLTIDRILKDAEFKLPDWGLAYWLEDGKGYTVLEKSQTVTNVSDVVRVEIESGRRDILVSASNLVVKGEAQPHPFDQRGRKHQASSLRHDDAVPEEKSTDRTFRGTHKIREVNHDGSNDPRTCESAACRRQS